MTKIGLLSDTHSYLDPQILEYCKEFDEIWHAGDFGNMDCILQLQQIKPLRAVFGNIDDAEVRHLFPEQLYFTCEKVKVYMQHIGGYPGKYAPQVKNNIISHASQLFISGHSHILKIMYDEKLNCLHMNPGAAGKHGWQKVRTMISFTIHEDNIQDCNIIELGPK